jgi:dTDP-4-dehydrorhamnose 3,5-epimerase
VNVVETSLPGVLIVEPRVFGDHRGFFKETFNEVRYREAGIDGRFVQDNHSRSRRGVLRGLHYQLTKPQGKLVWVEHGSVYDVAVDVRRGSPTFGDWVGVELSEANHRQLWIPPGFAHGFLVTSEACDFVYKCTELYDPPGERGVAWDDPAIGITWPDLGVAFALSDKDLRNPRLADQPDLTTYVTGPASQAPVA